MIKRQLLVVFSILFYAIGTKTMEAQPTQPVPNLAIVLNEYCAANTTGPADNFGQLSDWVELYNAHTSSVSLAGYYLSNDPNNLKKWAFPADFKLGVGGYGLVWLSGKYATPSGGNFHANFTLEQSKDQWLILSTAQGAIRDSVLVQRHKPGHTWGRIENTTKGMKAWKLYTANSQLFENPKVNYYEGYYPTPKMFARAPSNPPTQAMYNAKINTGGFYVDGAQTLFARLNGNTYDTTYFSCVDLYYTTNGNYPIPGTGYTKRYTDSVSGIVLEKTSVVRMIATANILNTVCPSSGLLNSFCETNTYFSDPEHQSFSEDFGVVSLALDRVDSAWFASQGNPPSTTVHVEYYDKKNHISEGYGTLNRPIQEDWRTEQKGFYISIDDRYGFGSNFEGQIFNVDGLGASSRTVFPTLHLKSGDIESHSKPIGAATATSFGTAVRDVFIQSLAAKYNLNVNPLHIKPVITFINGVYQGVYDLREVYDKYYENYYNRQSLDSLDMVFYHNGEGSVSYADGAVSTFKNNFKATVFNKSYQPLGPSAPNYTTLMTQLDKNSFIDYMILNSFAENSNIWNYNVAFAKGGQPGKPGGKWHYYLWNMPTIFNFTALATNTLTYSKPDVNPCLIQLNNNYPVSPRAFNGHGIILYNLMNPVTGSKAFQLEYKNRYQDLLNSALKCENITKHYEYIYNLYIKEMKCHEDPSCVVGIGPFNTVLDQWDSNMVRLYKVLKDRCDFVATTPGKPSGGCFWGNGPYPLTVNVEPAGAGTVKLNTMWLDSYPWSGNYYETTMSFKAVSTNTTQYRFHHWKMEHTANDPLSKDSIGVVFAKGDNVVAVFTDITKDITNSGDWVNIPSGFSPNGDGLNETFRPLGSAEFVTEYQMSVWNRWGQEVYRSTDPISAGWDGNYNGQQSLTGVYAYVVTYKNAYGEAKILKGNVTLTR